MNERLIVLVNWFSESERLKFSKFAEKTGIERNTVKNIFHGKQRINQDHIEAICSAFPEYRYWFVFGETDPEKGQISPVLDDVMQAYNR